MCEILRKIPHGPLIFSKDIPNFVETSINLAQISCNPNEILIISSIRSSIENELEKVKSKIEKLSKEIGSKLEYSSSYPGWKTDLNSSFLKFSHKEYSKVYNKPVVLTAVHAGLELGIFKNKRKELELISIGPEIQYYHSRLLRDN